MEFQSKLLTRDYSESASNPGTIYATCRFQGPNNEMVIVPMSFAQAQLLNFNDEYPVTIVLPS